MIPTITAFEQSPDRGQGLARSGEPQDMARGASVDHLGSHPQPPGRSICSAR